MQSNSTLHELVGKVQNGDEEAIVQVIDRFAPITQKYVRRLGYDDAHADLVVWLIWAMKKYRSNNNNAKIS